jgi:hypothetical protein
LPSVPGLCYVYDVAATHYEVWEQYPGETSADYNLFLTYLEQGAARSCANVARRANGLTTGYSYQYVCRLAKAWLWEERAEAFDAHQAIERQAAFKKLETEKLARWAHNQLELAELSTQLVRNELIAMADAQTQGKRIPATALVQLMDRLHKWQQLSTGGATESIAATFDLSTLPEAAKEALQSEAVRLALEAIAKG